MLKLSTQRLTDVSMVLETLRSRALSEFLKRRYAVCSHG